MIASRLLIIQTAYLGDLILTTSLIRSIHAAYPDTSIDIVIREGNQVLLCDYPGIHRILTIDKKQKFSELKRLAREIRSADYEIVIDTHQHGSSSLLSLASRAAIRIGFKRPFSRLFYTHRVDPAVLKSSHQLTRWQALLAPLQIHPLPPRLYPSPSASVQVPDHYVTISPCSVWKTKTWPVEYWRRYIRERIDAPILFCGAPSDRGYIDEIMEELDHPSMYNSCGEVSIEESLYLMQHAAMNYVHDSAPLHMCSAIDTRCTAIYCSTSPKYGFGPLSTVHEIIEPSLDCHPCGAHGHRQCPKGHFDCARLSLEDALNS